jgi:hypothetical protein
MPFRPAAVHFFDAFHRSEQGLFRSDPPASCKMLDAASDGPYNWDG